MKSTNIKIAALLLFFSAIVIASLCIGGVFLNPLDFFSGSSAQHAVLIKMRLPRLLTAASVGAALAASGAVFQALFSNPLADPYTTGVSGGAAFAATFAIIFGISSAYLPFFALAGAASSIGITLVISRKIPLSDSRLILSGIAQGMVFSAGIMILFALSASRGVHKALIWMMGDLSIARYEILLPASVAITIMLAVIFLYSRRLDIISFGDSFTRNAGITKYEIAILFTCASALTAVCVAMAGTISFVGLLVPHIARKFFGHSHISFMPASVAGGAVFLVLCDTIARTAAYPFEFPAGAICALCGGIFFIFLALREARRI